MITLLFTDKSGAELSAYNTSENKSVIKIQSIDGPEYFEFESKEEIENLIKVLRELKQTFTK